MTKNAKQADANTRLPLHLCPPVLQVRVAAVMKAALNKPGRYAYNYQDESSLTSYIDAAERHLAKLKDGEWLDEDSGEPHAAAVAANMAIILHCDMHGTLKRDLPGETGKLSALIDEYQEKYKDALQTQHPGVVRFEDGKDCGDSNCRAEECLKTRLDRMAECHRVPENLSEKGWKCTRGQHEGSCAVVFENLQCEDCMLLKSEESSVKVRNHHLWHPALCNDCDKNRIPPIWDYVVGDPPKDTDPTF